MKAMHRRSFARAALAILLLPGAIATAGNIGREQDNLLATLMGFGDWEPPYRVDPYLRIAIQLQTLGEEEGSRRLMLLAEQNARDPGPRRFVEEDSLYVLCRMLFVARPGREFRRPYIGKPGFLGGTTYRDWPLEPIELVRGIPFMVVTGYAGSGTPESPSDYLEYCLKDCVWRGERFKMHTMKEKRRVLARFLADKRWRKPINRNRYPGFFDRQII